MRRGRGWIRGGLNMVWTCESEGFFSFFAGVASGVVLALNFETTEEVLEFVVSSFL